MQELGIWSAGSFAADEMIGKKANPRADVDVHTIKYPHSSSGSSLCSWRVLFLCFHTKAAAPLTQKTRDRSGAAKAPGRGGDSRVYYTPGLTRWRTTTNPQGHSEWPQQPPAPPERNGKFISVPQESLFPPQEQELDMLLLWKAPNPCSDALKQFRYERSLTHQLFPVCKSLCTLMSLLTNKIRSMWPAGTLRRDLGRQNLGKDLLSQECSGPWKAEGNWKEENSGLPELQRRRSSGKPIEGENLRLSKS